MKFLAFGDSFVKMFLHCSNVKYYKFKGKSIKGLVKEQDQERKKIQTVIRKTPNESILFVFGQVDFNFVRYYKALNDEPQITQAVFQAYVRWVGTLSKKSVIISIFPTPISKANVIRSLTTKLTYPLEKVCPENDEIIYHEYDKTDEIWFRWNGWLHKYCEKYKVRIIQLFPNNQLGAQFRDVSAITPHLRYVPVLKLVKKHFNIDFDEQEAEKVQKNYEADKEERVKNSKIRQIQRENNEQQTMIQRLHAKSEDHINIPPKNQQVELPLSDKESKKQSSTSQSKQELISISSAEQQETSSVQKVKPKPQFEIVIGKNKKKTQKKTEKKTEKPKKQLKFKPKISQEPSSESDDVDADLLLTYAKKK